MPINYADELQGKNVYQLKKKTIIYEPLKKKAYILTDTNLKDYQRLNNRGIISIIIIAIGIYFVQSLIASLVMGGAFYIITTVYYYQNFLTKLNEFEGFSRDKYSEYQAYTPNVARKILLVMALIMIVILIAEYYIVHR